MLLLICYWLHLTVNPCMKRGVTVLKSKKNNKLKSNGVLVLKYFTIIICEVNVLVSMAIYMNFNITRYLWDIS